MDKSNGYEAHAATFIRCRSKGIDGVGATSVRQWATALPPNAVVLDAGCGMGLPVTRALLDAGATVYGVDASPSMVRAFRQNFPDIPVACEPAEDSSFFNRQFDAIIAWGLLFLLPEKKQDVLIRKMADALVTGGKLLFTAPSREMKWEDAITEIESVSLGAEKYKQLLTESGLSLVEEFEDEGENHYYHAVRL
ncbi:putative methyltransferase [Dyadobacter beijingensis]|uniref:Methyltransferase n=1 Tax=Dyadobacter beijingensis TaxID=365489 RepID=A0ABQ2HCK7_9BACT|nr:class I SAM-dependent methyltransferase [Dyadobacter beijingensis]GGM74317.1 putative methyltransferase [Dyadobacter beijingensis]